MKEDGDNHVMIGEDVDVDDEDEDDEAELAGCVHDGESRDTREDEEYVDPPPTGNPYHIISKSTLRSRL